MRRFVCRRTIWIATLAVLLNALVPALAEVLAAQRAAVTGVICSAVGAVSAPQPQHEDGVAARHCPYCVPHGGTLAPPPAAGVFIAVDSDARRVAVPAPVPDRRRGAWTPTQPRAPPSSLA